MRIGLAGAASLALILVTASARAEEQLPVRFEVGARAGIGLPIGKAAGASQNSPQGTSLGDLVAWTVPLQLDIGARIGPVFVGGRASYAFGKTGSAFDAASSRSASDVRVGFEVLWHFAADHQVDPWAGIGVGYEWLNLSASANNGSVVYATLRGFEWVNVQVGIDFALGRTFRIGPYLESSVGQYDSASGGIINVQGGEIGGSTDVQSKAVHAWIGFGLRFVVLL
jgi:hypothetical protein